MDNHRVFITAFLSLLLKLLIFFGDHSWSIYMLWSLSVTDFTIWGKKWINKQVERKEIWVFFVGWNALINLRVGSGNKNQMKKKQTNENICIDRSTLFLRFSIDENDKIWKKGRKRITGNFVSLSFWIRCHCLSQVFPVLFCDQIHSLSPSTSPVLFQKHTHTHIPTYIYIYTFILDINK